MEAIASNDETLPEYKDILAKQGYKLVSWNPDQLNVDQETINDSEQGKIDRLISFFLATKQLQQHHKK